MDLEVHRTVLSGQDALLRDIASSQKRRRECNRAAKASSGRPAVASHCDPTHQSRTMNVTSGASIFFIVRRQELSSIRSTGAGWLLSRKTQLQSQVQAGPSVGLPLEGPGSEHLPHGWPHMSSLCGGSCNRRLDLPLALEYWDFTPRLRRSVRVAFLAAGHRVESKPPRTLESKGTELAYVRKMSG